MTSPYGWNVTIGRADYDMDVRLYIWRDKDGRREILQYGDPSKVVVEDGANVEPSLRLSFGIPPLLVEALAKHGIRPDTDAKTEGILEATRAHLQDMRLLAGVVGTITSPPSKP